MARKKRPTRSGSAGTGSRQASASLGPASSRRGPGRPSKREERAFAIYSRISVPGLNAAALKNAAKEAYRMADAFEAASRERD